MCLCYKNNNTSSSVSHKERWVVTELYIHGFSCRMLLDCFGLLNITCFTLNISEVIKPEQRHLTAHQLCSFECHMAKVSKFTPELSSQLHYICQIIRDVVHLWTGNTVSHPCRLPSFKQDLDSYVYAKCLLELVDEWLGKATFRIHWLVGY